MGGCDSPKQTGITVTIRRGATSKSATRSSSEGVNSPADVFLTENSPAMALVDKAGLFEPLPADILDQIPRSTGRRNGHWTGIAARSTVFAYNINKLNAETLPKTMEELADTELEAALGGLAIGCGLPGDCRRLSRTQGEGRDSQMADRGCGRMPLWCAATGPRWPRPTRTRSMGRADLPLLLVRTPGGHQGEQRQYRAALLQKRTKIRCVRVDIPAAACWLRPSTKNRPCSS
jgi:hypothetical protein